MKVFDPGHIYQLKRLDVKQGSMFDHAYLQFVKRNNPPEMYPGNKDSFPGTTSQEVMRALFDRNEYVNNQVGSIANMIVRWCLRLSIWALEFRAAHRHGKFLWVAPWNIEKAPACEECGHTFYHIH